MAILEKFLCIALYRSICSAVGCDNFLIACRTGSIDATDNETGNTSDPMIAASMRESPSCPPLIESLPPGISLATIGADSTLVAKHLRQSISEMFVKRHVGQAS